MEQILQEAGGAIIEELSLLEVMITPEAMNAVTNNITVGALELRECSFDRESKRLLRKNPFVNKDLTEILYAESFPLWV